MLGTFTTSSLRAMRCARGALARDARGASACRAPFSSSPTDVTSTAATDAPDSKSGSKLLHSFKDMTDTEVVDLIRSGKVSQYKLERELKRAVLAGLEPDCKRAVRVRREWLNGENDESNDLDLTEAESSRGLPYADFDFNNFYTQVLGTNCENVIGYVPIPVGFVGPLLVSGQEYYVPLATTEGALVASTNRGCRAITESGGATSNVFLTV